MATEFVSKEQAAMEFAALTGEQRKKRGIKKAVSHHKEELVYVQSVAIRLGRTRELVTIEDVRKQVELDFNTWTLHNAAGAVFRTGDWEWAGFVRAKRPEAQSRVIRTWRLKK